MTNKLVLISGRSHSQLAEDVARSLGVSLLLTESRDFANGEIYARFTESVRGADVFVLQSHSGDVNKWIMELLIIADALKRASAKQVTAILPCYPYARQDKKSRGREPISARLIADLLKTAGCNRLMSVDLHAPQIQGFFDGPVDHLFAMPVLFSYCVSHFTSLGLDIRRDVLVVSPDMGRVRLADAWSNKLDCPLAIIHKRRDPTIANKTSLREIVGCVEGKVCLLVDDLIDTAGTIVQAAEALREHGARAVIVAATHAVFSPPASSRLQSSCIDSVIVTDTVPLKEEQKFEGLKVLSVADLFARAIREVFNNGSVTSMFDGELG